MLENLSNKLSNVFNKIKNKGKINEDDLKTTLREIKLILLESDVNYKIVKEIINDIEKEVIGQNILKSLRPEHIIIKAVNDKLVDVLSAENSELNFYGNPSIIMLAGLQGAGKTTTAGKLGKLIQKQNRKCMLVPCDIKRPAAFEQLQQVANKAELLFYDKKENNVITVINQAIKYAGKENIDTLILDTAGRLHIDDTLMHELSEIQKQFNPCEILYVSDAMTGQDAVNSAKGFNEKINITGIILTKMDGDQKGGAALSVVKITGKPIKFITTGEYLNQIERFYPDRLVSRLLGMGDIVSLVEKTQELISIEESQNLEKKLQKGKFDFEDYLNQLKQLKNMGSLADIVKMIPGVGNKLKLTGMEEGQLKKVEAIILSMTKEERKNPYLLKNMKRIRRIAKGSGTTVKSVKFVVKQHKQMNKMMKKLSKGDFKGFPF